MSNAAVHVALAIEWYKELPPLFAEMAPVFAYESSGDVTNLVTVGDTVVAIRAFSTSEIEQAVTQLRRGGSDLIAASIRASGPLCESVLEFCDQGPSLLIAGQTVLFEHIVRAATAHRLLQSDPEKKGFPVAVRFSSFYGNPGGGYTGRPAAFCGYQFDMQKSPELLAEAICDLRIIEALHHVPLDDNLGELTAAFNLFGQSRQDKYKPIIAVVPGF